MGRSHSKAEKSQSIINEKAPLSPRQKRQKLKKENDRKKTKKFSTSTKKSKLESLKMPRPPDYLEFDEMDMEGDVKRRMQDQLAFNSDIFVLNQMMMSVQFFANYER